MHRWPGMRPPVAAALIATVGLLLVACSSSVPGGPSGAPTSGSTTTAPPTATASAAPVATASRSIGLETADSQSPTDAVGGEPPAATLSVEGGDPVAGQLGSFTWSGGGSDSPWLPGTPISIGADERLIASLAGGFPVDTWSARSAPATSSNGAGASGLDGGSGNGVITFAPPPKGRWSVQLSIGFADQRGSATYYWQVTVR